jgi:hypothetical protein
MELEGRSLIPRSVQTGPGAPIKWLPDALSSAIKLPGRESNHSPPSSAEVKEAHIHLHGAVLD